MLTVRINELPPRENGVDIAPGDLVPIWGTGDNKTRRVSIQDLVTYFSLGGVTTAHPPVVFGGVVIYTVPGVIAPGTKTVSLPDLAGKDFTLRRGGYPMEPLKDDLSNADTAEYDILDGGGFRLLKDGDELAPLERYELTVFSLFASGPNTNPGAGSSGSGIAGKVTISENTVIDPVLNANKVHQIRNSAAIDITLPSIADVRVNSWFLFETNINSSKPVRFLTTGGQQIYLKNQAKSIIWMHKGEVLKLYRDDDGWYLINDFYQVYLNLGRPQASYRVNDVDNELLCKGQLLERADYPRLWEYVQSVGNSLVSDPTWQTATATVAGRSVPRPYRGCFSTGTTSTNFRMPDLMDMFLRGVATETGSNDQRFLNSPGGLQMQEVLAHGHGLGVNGVQQWGGDSGGQQGGNDQSDTRKYTTDNYGGTETRPINIGTYWTLRY